jgi:hypothetical protein
VTLDLLLLEAAQSISTSSSDPDAQLIRASLVNCSAKYGLSVHIIEFRVSVNSYSLTDLIKVSASKAAMESYILDGLRKDSLTLQEVEGFEAKLNEFLSPIQINKDEVVGFRAFLSEKSNRLKEGRS